MSKEKNEYEYKGVKFVELEHDPHLYPCPDCILNSWDCNKIQKEILSDGEYCIRYDIYFVESKSE